MFSLYRKDFLGRSWRDVGGAGSPPPERGGATEGRPRSPWSRERTGSCTTPSALRRCACAAGSTPAGAALVLAPPSAARGSALGPAARTAGGAESPSGDDAKLRGSGTRSTQRGRGPYPASASGPSTHIQASTTRTARALTVMTSGHAPGSPFSFNLDGVDGIARGAAAACVLLDPDQGACPGPDRKLGEMRPPGLGRRSTTATRARGPAAIRGAPNLV